MFERQVLFGEQEVLFEKLVRGVSIQNDVSFSIGRSTAIIGAALEAVLRVYDNRR